MSEKFISK